MVSFRLNALANRPVTISFFLSFSSWTILLTLVRCIAGSAVICQQTRGLGESCPIFLRSRSNRVRPLSVSLFCPSTAGLDGLWKDGCFCVGQHKRLQFAGRKLRRQLQRCRPDNTTISFGFFSHPKYKKKRWSTKKPTDEWAHSFPARLLFFLFLTFSLYFFNTFSYLNGPPFMPNIYFYDYFFSGPG